MIAAAEVSLHVEVGDPKVALRFFLRPKEKFVKSLQYKNENQTKWYSLCAEILTEINDNAAIEIIVVTTGDGAQLSTESKLKIFCLMCDTRVISFQTEQ